MDYQFENVLPEEIEKRSFAIITEELGDITLDPEKAPIIKRVIHTSADFDYVQNLCFSDNVVQIAQDALRNGASILTDTKMASVGINAGKLKTYGGKVYCFMSDQDVALEAKEKGSTRAAVCMDKACTIEEPLIIAVGNAPTALIRLDQLIREGRINPVLVIGVPVGFVNVVQSKELIMQSGVSFIVARGRKGGSNVAAAICNALLYSLT
ncbi:precorrin-8X methylmutase [Dehalobacter sp. DCM]|uniref:precorrin-8X methylmutase n=1 Tax=Dehalobacter sp. DCM TaxID=2907827 RepID=UPI00308143AB|nr:precorrin-8X methylmutase [Dehalobacter sp. DCM]